MSQRRLAVVVIVGLLVSPGIAQAGGTFRYSLDTDIDYVDPALAYSTSLVGDRVRDLLDAHELSGCAGSARVPARARRGRGNAQGLS